MLVVSPSSIIQQQKTKGLDFLDREKAKRQAIQQAQDNINY